MNDETADPVTDAFLKGGLEAVAAVPATVRQQVAEQAAAELAIRTPRTLGELRADPAMMRVPEDVVPHIAKRGCVTLKSGREKVGKSEIISQAGAAVSVGGTFLGMPVRQGRVLFLALDEWSGFLVQRLIGAGASDDVLIETERVAPHELGPLIRRFEIDLVIIDTLREFVQGIVQDSAKDTEWVVPLGIIRRAAAEGQAAIVLLHHNTKGTDDYSGSQQLGSGVDILVNMKRVPGAPKSDPRRVFEVTARLPMTSFTAAMLGGRYEMVSEGDLDGPVDFDGDASGRDLTLEQKILAHVAHHPGDSLRGLGKGVGGNNDKRTAAIASLIAAGRLVDAGSEKTRAFYLPGNTPAQTVPNTVPNAPVGNASGNALGAPWEHPPQPSRERAGNALGTLGEHPLNAGGPKPRALKSATGVHGTTAEITKEAA